MPVPPQVYRSQFRPEFFCSFASKAVAVGIVCFCLAGSGGLLAQEESKVLVDWKFADYSDDILSSQVDGGAELKLSENSPSAPTLVEVAGIKGLRFRDGQCLTGNWWDLSVEHGQPFTVTATIIPEAPPPGAFGGIFEACGYQDSGFRIVLTKDFHVAVEIFVGVGEENHRGITSHAVLEPGRPSTVGVRFDGTLVTLSIDGVDDNVADMGFPAPFDGPVSVGRAAGDRYFLNGVISEIKISSP